MPVTWLLAPLRRGRYDCPNEVEDAQPAPPAGYVLAGSRLIPLP